MRRFGASLVDEQAIEWGVADGEMMAGSSPIEMAVLVEGRQSLERLVNRLC